MSRVPAGAKIWFAILVLPWLVAVGIAVTLVATGELRYSRIVVRGSHSPDGYPHFLGMRTGQAALVPGDALLRIGDQDLRGASSLAFMGRAMDAARGDPVVELRYARADEARETRVDLSPRRGPWVRRLVIGLSCGLIGIVVFLRVPRDRRAVPLLGVLTLYGTQAIASRVQGGGAELTLLTNALAVAGTGLFPVFGCLMLLRWPDRPLSWIEKLVPCLFVPLSLPTFATWHPGTLGYAGALELWAKVDALRTALGLGLVIRAYRLCDARGRRQLRWAALGLGVAMSIMTIANLARAFDPDFSTLRDWSLLVMLVVPAGFVVAILRDDLFDVDRLIGATVSYTILGIALLAILLVGIPRLAHATATNLGIPADAGQVVFSLCCAALVVPAGRFVRPWIEALLFRERDALRRGVGKLLGEIALAGHARELAERTGEILDSLLRPEALAIYVREGDAFLPIAIRRQAAVPPALPAHGPLLERLETSADPLDVEGWRRRGSLGELSEGAVAAVAGVSVVVPVLVQGQAVSFLALGPKRSGDIYTQTDRALLTLVSQATANRIVQLDQEAVLGEVRSMRDSLRRYVPGAIADQLTTGAELVTGTQEVSVLFVDIRGYTALAEGAEAEAIFSFVNRYTEAVSAVVRRHGGSVVEFSGDGMMAVFGAPYPDPQKERSAVQSALEILGALDELESTGKNGEVVRVGVGIASGEAYVGNVQAVDRMIWTALGNTTNLAARLQALTRDMDAAVVIDARTWEKARDLTKDFEPRPGVEIRGRRDNHDLYALPLT